MKIAILGDVHGNLPAFQNAIAYLEKWGPDQVVLTGDIVNRGPCSPACLSLAKEKIDGEGWLPLIGNHEEYVIDQANSESPRQGPEFEAFRSTHWTFLQLGKDVSEIAGWLPFVELEGQEGGTVRVAHASVLGTQAGIFPQMRDEVLVARGGQPPAAVFAAGHTHLAFQRTVDGTQYVNVGAVGVPFDGDTRSGLALLTWKDGAWKVEVVRLAYDQEQTIRDCQRSGFLTEAGPLAWLILAELLFAESQLFAWHRDHYEAVCAGERGMAESVRIQLESQGKWEQVSAYL
jgi:predicted phosphodiesterase